ncbi:TRI65 protein, partial [Aegotheles bennettii]|nr:TRI65 protein [Aegotheles bennettii]
PTSRKVEEKLVCSICLELFQVPVTLPCGHNFCKRCIGDYWHRQEQRAKQGYTCPQCRRDFERCPELEKNVTLCNLVELVRDGRVVQVLSAERCEVARGDLCPQHGHPLELYCQEEQRCVCCVCTVRQCQRHRRVLLEEERARKQALLKESLEKAQVESERLEQEMQELEERTRSVKDSSEELKSVILSKFTLLREALERCQWQTVARIEREQAAALGHIGDNWNLLKDRLDLLSQHKERTQHLLACPDHRTFLQVSFPPAASPMAFWDCFPMGTGVSFLVLVKSPCHQSLFSFPGAPSGTGRCSKVSLEPSLLQAEHPNTLSLSPEQSSSSPLSIFMPLLFPDHRNLTFDPETANKYLELSKDNRKAKHSPSAAHGQQEQGPRFQPWQVLCTQGYGRGHHYWEVKISSHSVILGVTYHGLPRGWQQGHKFNIGLAGGSWGLQVREDGYMAWHKGRAERIRERLYKNLGISLEYDKGLLSFYGLGERTQLIHSFHSVFTEPLYPVFWLCEGRAVTLCRR